MRLGDTANRKFLALSIFAILLAALTWIAAWEVVGSSLGDIFHEDPLKEAELRAQAQLVAQVSLVTFFVSFALSSWLAGVLTGASKLVTGVVFSIHGLMTSVSFLFFFLDQP
jgi:hypothetical protein